MGDLLDQPERASRGAADPDQRDVGVFLRCHCGDCFDVDVAGDDLVSQSGDDLREQLEPLGLLVGDQDPQG